MELLFFSLFASLFVDFCIWVVTTHEIEFFIPTYPVHLVTYTLSIAVRRNIHRLCALFYAFCSLLFSGI